VPTELVASENRAYYDACDGADALCIPLPIVADADYVAADCTATETAAVYGDEYGPGVCAHVCQAGIDAVAPLLSENGCGGEFVCVPCLDPSTGEASGACPSDSRGGGA
jgi:hypothetical protein